MLVAMPGGAGRAIGRGICALGRFVVSVPGLTLAGVFCLANSANSAPDCPEGFIHTPQDAESALQKQGYKKDKGFGKPGRPGNECNKPKYRLFEGCRHTRWHKGKGKKDVLTVICLKCNVGEAIAKERCMLSPDIIEEDK